MSVQKQIEDLYKKIMDWYNSYVQKNFLEGELIKVKLTGDEGMVIAVKYYDVMKDIPRWEYIDISEAINVTSQLYDQYLKIRWKIDEEDKLIDINYRLANLASTLNALIPIGKDGYAHTVAYEVRLKRGLYMIDARPWELEKVKKE